MGEPWRTPNFPWRNNYGNGYGSYGKGGGYGKSGYGGQQYYGSGKGKAPYQNYGQQRPPADNNGYGPFSKMSNAFNGMLGEISSLGTM
eukprot:6984923-Karenia_brevis.AAC.1